MTQNPSTPTGATVSTAASPAAGTGAGGGRNTPRESIGGGGGGSNPLPGPKFGGTYGPAPNVWIGGAPNEGFTASTNQEPATPLCIRGLDPVSEMKGYAKRVTDGYEVKFKRDDPDFPLMAFAAEALNHMQTHGMDTVFYMKGADASGEGAEDYSPTTRSIPRPMWMSSLRQPLQMVPAL